MVRRSVLAFAMLGAISALAAVPGAGGAHADPGPVEQHAGAPELHAHESGADDGDLDTPGAGRGLSRQFVWSDGPRRVPTPRGASKARAERLGLGTRECAFRLLHQRPDPAWIAAAGGRSPSRLLWPVDGGRWVRGFGYVRTTRPDLLHRGVDIAADPGTVVRAAADGIVAYSDNGVRGYGNLVMIVHRNGWVTLYAHNARTTVQPGYRVRRGERIALVGATGMARGPHLHFELWASGRPIDPAALFDGGPTFVQRIAAREAARGHVPPPAAVGAEDRPSEPPLPPHPDDRVVVAAARPTGSAERPAELAAREPVVREPVAPVRAERPGTLGGLSIGSLSLARRLLSRAPTEEMRAAAGGRLFSTLLSPVREGTIVRPFRSAREPMRVSGTPGAAIRAGADGLVAFAGELAGRGPAIVLVHRNGWVTAYVGAGEIAVRAGDRVERGAWIGRLSSAPIDFELRAGGVARDPASLLVAP